VVLDRGLIHTVSHLETKAELGKVVATMSDGFCIKHDFDYGDFESCPLCFEEQFERSVELRHRLFDETLQWIVRNSPSLQASGGDIEIGRAHV